MHGRKIFHIIPDSGQMEEVTFSYASSCGVTRTSGGPTCGNLLIVNAQTSNLVDTITGTNEVFRVKAPSVFDKKPDNKSDLPEYYDRALRDLITYVCHPAKVPTKSYDIVSSKCSGAGRTLTRVRVHPAMSWDFELGLGLSFKTQTLERSYVPGSFNPRLRTDLKDKEKATFYVTLKASDGSEELSLDTTVDKSHSSDLSKRLFRGLQKQFTNLSGLLAAIERKYGGVDGKVDIKWPKAVFSGNLSQIELPQEAGVGFQGDVGLAASPFFGAAITVDLLDMILEHGGKLFGPWGAAIGKIALFVKRWAAEDRGDSTIGATLNFGFPFTTGGDIKADAKWVWSDAKAGAADEPGQRGGSGSLSGRVFFELKGDYKVDAHIKGEFIEFKAGKEKWYKSGSAASGETESAIGKDGLQANGQLEFTGLSVYKLSRSQVSAGGSADKDKDRNHIAPFSMTASGKRTDELTWICNVIPVFKWPEGETSNLEALVQ